MMPPYTGGRPKPDLKVVTLNESNYRDPVATLRLLADQVEAGAYGPVGSIAVVILADEMSVHGMGEESEGPGIALLLHAGFMSLSDILSNHGKDVA